MGSLPKDRYTDRRRTAGSDVRVAPRTVPWLASCLCSLSGARSSADTGLALRRLFIHRLGSVLQAQLGVQQESGRPCLEVTVDSAISPPP